MGEDPKRKPGGGSLASGEPFAFPLVANGGTADAARQPPMQHRQAWSDESPSRQYPDGMFDLS